MLDSPTANRAGEPKIDEASKEDKDLKSGGGQVKTN
jgi:hypothetical protein